MGDPEAPAIAIMSEPRLELFISFSSCDLDLKNRLVNTVGNKEIRFFDPNRDIKPLDIWKAELQDRIENADCILILYTENSSKSEVVQWEYEEAVRRRKLIWAIKDVAAPVHNRFGLLFEEIDAFKLIAGQENACFMQVRAKLDERFPPFKGIVKPENCPYPGISPFGLDARFSADLFYGRDHDIQEIRTAILRNPQLLLLYAPSGAGKTSLLSVGLAPKLANIRYGQPVNGRNTCVADELFREAYRKIRVADPPPELNVIDALRAAVERDSFSKCVICFDQMETFFINAPSTEKEVFRDKLHTLLTDRRPKNLTVILSFRKEIFAEIEDHLKRKRRDVEWDGIYLRRLSPRDALDCMIEPARKQGVRFDKTLAQALVKALPRDQGDDAAVNPMDIQKVCDRLWRIVADSPLGRRSQIHEYDLRDSNGSEIAGDDLDARACRFVEMVQRDHLNQKIEASVRDGRSADVLRVSLMQFVAPDRSRRRVKESADGKTVGRLSSEIVEALVSSHLVEKLDDRREYELVHDALAVEISSKFGNDKWVAALSRLEMEIGDSSGKLSFNTHSDLLLDLEEIRQKRGIAFDEQQVKFLLACALGDRRTTVSATPISLQGWADLLLEKDGTANFHSRVAALMEVLTAAFSQDNPAVTADSLELAFKLARGGHGGALRPELIRLGNHLRALALNGTTHDVRARACALLLNLDDAEQIGKIFDDIGGPQAKSARRAVGLLRHAVDTCRGPGAAYWSRWRSLRRYRRWSVLRQLMWIRAKTSLVSLAVIICVCAPVTGIGAAIPFMPMGYLGSSLTLEGTKNAWATGIFHGMTGGLNWGLGVTTLLLLYCLIWKGGRIPKGRSQTVVMSIYAAIGGFLGGWANFLAIGPVYTPEGLFHAGWTTSRDAYTLSEMLWTTRHGWIMPLFGAFLGPGIAWSLMRIVHDPLQRFSAGGFGGLHQNIRSVWIIARKVLVECWRNVLWLAMGSYLITLLIVPGPGICDPSNVRHNGCNPAFLLAPLWARSFGLGFIILGGSLFLEIAFLFSLIVVRSGFTLEPDRSFLRSAEIRTDLDSLSSLC